MKVISEVIQILYCAAFMASQLAIGVIIYNKDIFHDPIQVLAIAVLVFSAAITGTFMRKE